MNAPKDYLVTETEAAERLGIRATTLSRWRWAGRGPIFHKIGSAVRYRLSEIEEFIEKGRRQSTAEQKAR